jgi:hypothetical protein
MRATTPAKSKTELTDWTAFSKGERPLICDVEIWKSRIRKTDRKEQKMNNPNKPKTPEFLKGATVDENGLPLRMKLEGERRLDQPYQSAKKFKLTWNRFQGVVIVPEN